MRHGRRGVEVNAVRADAATFVIEWSAGTLDPSYLQYASLLPRKAVFVSSIWTQFKTNGCSSYLLPLIQPSNKTTQHAIAGQRHDTIPSLTY